MNTKVTKLKAYSTVPLSKTAVGSKAISNITVLRFVGNPHIYDCLQGQRPKEEIAASVYPAWAQPCHWARHKGRVPDGNAQLPQLDKLILKESLDYLKPKA